MLPIKFSNSRHFHGGSVVKISPSNAEGASLIPGWEAKISHASWPKNQNIKEKQYCTKFNKDFKNGPNKKKLIFFFYQQSSMTACYFFTIWIFSFKDKLLIK